MCVDPSQLPHTLHIAASLPSPATSNSPTFRVHLVWSKAVLYERNRRNTTSMMHADCLFQCSLLVVLQKLLMVAAWQLMVAHTISTIRWDSSEKEPAASDRLAAALDPMLCIDAS